MPQWDPFFDPKGTDSQFIEFIRSNWDPDSGTGPANPRQQVNELSSFVDASMVYGSDQARADALRTERYRQALAEGITEGIVRYLDRR